MLKNLVYYLMVIIFVFPTLSIGFAAEKGNPRKGKHTYRNVYKSCNKRGEVGSIKPLLSPNSKTRAQWKRTFEKKDFDQFKCKEDWSKLSDKDLNDIFTYLYDHAVDSPSPAKCQ